MKTSIKIQYLILLPLFIISISCRKVHTYEGKAIIISRSTDLTLKDSSLIYGSVYSAVDEKTPEIYANIWIEGTNIKTISDTLGYFSIKLLPGTYTIKCLGQYSNQSEVEVLKAVSILSNEKINIKFLQLQLQG